MNKDINKRLVCVIFGGESSEHDVSCISVRTIINNIDRDTYDIMLIGITKEGNWLLVDGIERIIDGSWVKGDTAAVITPDKKTHGAHIINKDGTYETKYIDVIFPVLHGLFGEDGTIQGLFEMAGIPYVGCGVLASSAGMDKLTTKKIVESLNIRQAGYVAVYGADFANLDGKISVIEERFSYPVFVKPSNAGSSVGVSKASDRNGLIKALNEARRHDDRILVEESIYGREVECAVLGTDDIKASGIGEILSAADFYDYDAKYNNEESRTVIDPEIDEKIVEEIRNDAVNIFTAISGAGLSRVDFFIENGTNSVVFNEINTLPGFTDISMYPMLWEARGIDRGKLIAMLIESASCRTDRR